MVCSIEVFRNNDSINTVLHFGSLEHCEGILLTVFLSWVGRKLKPREDKLYAFFVINRATSGNSHN